MYDDVKFTETFLFDVVNSKNSIFETSLQNYFTRIATEIPKGIPKGIYGTQRPDLMNIFCTQYSYVHRRRLLKINVGTRFPPFPWPFSPSLPSLLPFIPSPPFPLSLSHPSHVPPVSPWPFPLSLPLTLKSS